MDIASLSGINSQNIQRSTSRLQSAIAALVSGKRLNKASDDIAALSIATRLQTAVASLKEVSGGVAQVSSLAQVADGGAEQIQGLLQDLRSVAAQAKSPTLSQSNRDALNVQFQALKSEIDRVAGSTSFNGRSLLDGSVSGDDAISISDLFGEENDGGQELSISSLSSSSLFDGQSLNVLSVDAATQAIARLDTALGRVTTARADIGAFQQSLDYVAASVDSAAANQEAARSILEDTDFAEESTIYSLLNLQRNAGLAIAAQSNRLAPGLLKLVE